MKRASYRDAIAWLAENEQGDGNQDQWLSMLAIEESPTSRSESAGRSDSNAGPMLKCDPRAVRIAFWVSYLLAAVIVCALLARVWGLA